jgi:DNA mismatch repair protein MSH6
VYPIKQEIAYIVDIPPSDYYNLTAFEKQFWDIKRKNFDSIIFFKKGKFYELYEQDADIAHEKLDLKVSDRVNMRMAGVPETHFTSWAAKLIKLGYKVGRVDQMETSIGMNKRQKSAGQRDSKVSLSDIIERHRDAHTF